MGSVLVIRPHDGFSETLIRNGFTVVNLELIATEALQDQTELRDALTAPAAYDGFFVTSPAAASVMADCLRDLGLEHTGNIYVLGERSRRIFDDAGINIEFCPAANTSADLITEFGEAQFAGRRFCFVRGDRSMHSIPDMLRGKALVDELIVYRTIETTPDENKIGELRHRLAGGEFDWVCFFSTSAVDAFVNGFGRPIAGAVKAAVIGPTTAERASKCGFDVAFISPRSNAEDFANSLVERTTLN
jgi:uroporphyrinogen-III synthase